MFFNLDISTPIYLTRIEKIQLNQTDSKRYFVNQTNRGCLILVHQGTILLDNQATSVQLTGGFWYLLPAKQAFSISLTQDQTALFFKMDFSTSRGILKTANTPFFADSNFNALILPQTFFISESDTANFYLSSLVEKANSNFQNDLSLNYTFSTWLIFLSKQYYEYLADNQAKQATAKFETIVDWISSNVENVLSVNEVADKFELTPTYLTTLFNKYYGISTLKFIHKMKISKAKDLLLTTNLSVKQVGYYLSFTNTKYFMRLFKQETGYTPTSFRNTFALQATSKKSKLGE
jgi:AraC-like DNA-binding protein